MASIFYKRELAEVRVVTWLARPNLDLTVGGSSLVSVVCVVSLERIFSSHCLSPSRIPFEKLT